MFDPKVREDVFPFICENPECQQAYGQEEFKDLLRLWGVVYADCGNFIYQGITCRKCKKTSLKPLPRDNPLVDLRDFIIVPNSNPAANTWEQFIQRERMADEHDFLKFKSIPAWEDETIGYVDLVNRYPSDSYALYTTPGVPYLMMIPGDVERKQEKENETGEIQLRRLYPDTPRFRNLLVCLSPSRISRVEIDEEGVSPKWSEGDPKQLGEKSIAWIEILKQTAGESLREAVRSRLAERGDADFDENLFQEALERNLWLSEYDPTETLEHLSTQVGFEETIWQHFQDAVRPVIYPICTEIALERDRNKALGWTKRVAKEKALFVDGPMGLGKVYALPEALVENEALSAIIFMPTHRLCQEIVRYLKIRIAQKKGLKYWKHFDYENGFLKRDLKRELLQKEVYYVDSLNEKECPYYEELAAGYRQHWTFNKDTCEDCEKKAYCRFISHQERAPFSRIIVATHYEYAPFCENPNLCKWFKQGVDEKRDAVGRDVFALAEDFIFSRCYQPLILDEAKTKEFLTKSTEFLSPFDKAGKAIGHVDQLFKEITKCDDTAITPPVNATFRFSNAMVKNWKKSFHHSQLSIPEALRDVGRVEDYLQWLEHAIRLGVVVERKNGSLLVHFPNPTAYNLSKLPAHAFFDATMPEDHLVEKKLQDIQFEQMTLDIKPFGRIRVTQNGEIDLPGKSQGEKAQKVQEFIQDLLREQGKDHRYFFVASETTIKGYLKGFLEKEYPELDPVVVSYGGLDHGGHRAKDCDIAVVLGGFRPSEGVEVAMALEWIRDILSADGCTPTESTLWAREETTGERVYKDDYALVGQLTKSLQFSEQRRALALTHYIIHDVDFYILSKDPVSDYEPFLSLGEAGEPRAEIAPHRFRRSDSKYQQVKQAVLDWLKENHAATVTQIHRNTGIRRGTVGEHLKQMEKENALVRKGKKYVLPS
ncbi:MAG: hypothetical protein SWH78_13815 [Thermodesulfobacteriota bacterium]|nr:hypothetical protein [Thermodesulfobacteriota bacterium]